jgi:micrococcal nuclease
MNELIVREGYAQVMTIPPNIKYQELFIEAERDARGNQRGILFPFCQARVKVE